MDPGSSWHAAVQKEFGLSEDELRRLSGVLVRDGLTLFEALDGLGLAEENRILTFLSRFLDLPLLESADYPGKPILLEGISVLFLRKHGLLPIQVENRRVRVVMQNPLDVALLNELESYFSGLELEVCLGRREEIQRAVDRLYGMAARGAEALAQNGRGFGGERDILEDDLEHLKGLA